MNSNKLYKKSINDIAKLMSVQSKVNMVGSASIKKTFIMVIMTCLKRLKGLQNHQFMLILNHCSIMLGNYLKLS